MRISITVVASDTVVSNDFIPLEVFPDMSLNDIKGFVEAEVGVPPSAQTFIIKEQIATETSKSLTDLGVGEGDIIGLAIQTRPRQPNGPTRPQGTSSQQQAPVQGRRRGPDPETLRLQLLADTNLMRQLRNSDPEIADAAGNPELFASLWGAREEKGRNAQREKEEMIAELEADPFNEEAQRKIEEIIRQERVMENMQKAYEENPESFGHVTMLYIDVLVNNTPIKAFVDSGAQTTIMSPDAAEKCGIMRLIDRRFAGIARGVGTAQILGRVHSAEIQIGPYNLASSFTVMEGKDVDLLLGLDMLKRHQMCIDLKDNCLRVANDKVPFLPENEIPKMMDNINKKEAKVEGPNGMTIGGTTGTVGPSATPASSSTASVTPPQNLGSRINIHPVGSASNVNSNRSPAPAPQTQASTDAPFGAPQPITEQSIAQVVELGFSRAQAIAALQQVGGNVELAIGLLL